MCKRNAMIGGALIAVGGGLLLSMLIPRSFWTIVVGVALVGLGILISGSCH